MSLMAYLPEFYGRSSEVCELQEVFGMHTSMLREKLQKLILQLNVSTATGLGLSLWEKTLGLPVEMMRPEEYRRSRIISKLRGHGNTTKAMIQSVAESFTNGAVEVASYPAEYRFEVKFTGTIGIPPNMDDVSDMLEEIKPAHLSFSYVFIYRTWQMLSGKTWGGLESCTWRDAKEGAIT